MRTGMKDYYKTLGVGRDATQAEIQKAFRSLAQKHHPDKKGGNAEKFKEINEAYQVLNDKTKRAQYDRTGFSGGSGASAAGGFGFKDFGFDINFDPSAAGGANFSDIFRSMFHEAVNRGENVEADIVISFEASVFGTRKRVKIPYRRKNAEEIDLNIPAGIQSGMRIHVPGKGEPAKKEGLPSGDLYIRVSVSPSKHFERVGGNIVYRLTLTPSEAFLGAEKEIPDIRGGKMRVKVPELSKEGATVAVPGKGIPQPAGTGRLIVLCQIAYPKSLSRKARELIRQLGRERGW